MIRRTDDGRWEGDHIQMIDAGRSPSGKTVVWGVWTKTEAMIPLGCVRWHAPWRKYCFYPEPNTLYEQTCLRDIAEFVESMTSLKPRERKG